MPGFGYYYYYYYYYYYFQSSCLCYNFLFQSFLYSDINTSLCFYLLRDGLKILASTPSRFAVSKLNFEVAHFADYSRLLAESFDSNFPGVENGLFW